MRKYFPLSAKTSDLKSLIVSLVIYIGVPFVLGLVSGLITWIPLVGGIIRIVLWVIDVYCGIGIIISLLCFFNVIKN